MKFQLGDKVAFINEKQNGVIVKTLPGGNVIVEIEDGFEIEVAEKELVKTGSLNLSKEKEELKPEKEVQESEAPSSLIKLCEQGSICLAGVPAATGAVLTGMVNYYLINNSNYDLAYTFHIKKQSNWSGVNRGILETSAFVLLTKFKREDLTDVESLLTEGLLFSKNKRPPINHIRKDTGILLPGITNTHPGLKGVTTFANVIELYNGKEPEPLKIDELVKTLSTRSAENFYDKKVTQRKEFISNKFGVYINEKVIDLHIEELTDDFSGLSNAEMLSIQMKRFSNEMDNAIKNNFKRIVFIHGVGNGILKREIRNALRNYAGTTIRDGEYSKYGNGATEVEF